MTTKHLMKMNSSKLIAIRLSVAGFAIAAFLCAGFQQANAAILAQYGFGTPAPGYTSAATEVAGNVTAGDFTAGSGIGDNGYFIVGNPDRSRRVGSGALGAAQDLADYFSFTVTANGGFLLNLDGGTLTFDAQKFFSGDPSGTANWAVRTTVSGFANANYSEGTMTTTMAPVTATTFSGATYDNLTDPFEVRIYMWNADTADMLLFDNVTLNGAVVPVPEPVNVAMGIFGLCAVGLGAGRRYLSKRS